MIALSAGVTVEGRQQAARQSIALSPRHRSEDVAFDAAQREQTPDGGQIDLLARWVEQGAKWDGHWAYLKPERPPPPTVRQRPGSAMPLTISSSRAWKPRG